MALTVVQDVARLTMAGYSLRDAIRRLARQALVDAERGAGHSSADRREIHRLMVATA